MKYPSYQLYPICHRNIHLLHSTVSIKHATPCSGPAIIVIDYYTDNDKCFGFYVHGKAKVDLIIEKYDIQCLNNGEMQGKNQRVMWSYCKECNYETPIIAMSDETYYLSIGKFFELNFYDCCSKKQLEFITNIDIKLKIDAYKFIRTKAEVFFDSVLKRLKRVKLDTFEKAEDGIQKIEELKIKLQEQSDSIYGRLQSIYDKIIPTNYLALNVVLRDLQKLGIYWDNEFNEFERTYLPSENEVNKITQFHLRKFLMDRYNDEDEDNNNNNNKKVVDVTGNESTSGSKETAALDDGKASSNKDCSDKSTPDNSQDSMEIDGDSKNTDDKSTNELSKPFPEFVPKKPRELPMNRNLSDSNIETKMFPQSTLYESGSNISERINKWNQTAETGDKTTPTQLLTHRGSDSSLKSINTVIPSQNKVIHLANFFDKMYYDQISLEFSKQRERELKRKSKVKAQPIFDSKPIVEIYNKIEDVVGPGVDDEKKKDIAVVKKDEQEKGQTKENQQESSQQQSQQQVQQQSQQQLDIPEKQSLLKSLTNFWADRAATLWDPLNYPLESHEHTFADSEVIVREDEPSSLVAFCLSSNDYKQKIKNAFEKNRMGDSGILNSNLQENKPHDDKPGVESEVGNSGITTESASIVTSVGDTKLEESSINNSSNAKAGESLLASDNKKGAQFAKIEKKFKKKLNKEGGINGGGGGTNNSGDNNNNDDNINPLESILTRNKSNHLKYQFIDGNTNLSCKIFYSEQFEALRKACGNDDNFIQSLSRCVKWQSSGGKSGSSFLKTLDNRYILKELSKSELESFVSIAPFYFKYISQSMFNTLTTAIAKIFGFYQVQIKNTTTGKIFRMDFLIMENLFYNHKTTRIFDLKGSMRNRHVQQTGKENEVLLDENMIEYIYESPVFVGQQSKKLLRGCLFNDTSFLSAMDVMDYSLVIGIDDSSKNLENWVKGNNLIGGNKRGKDPTIVTPKQYRIRFREAMERYILEAPDIWYEGSK
ncbi:Phosphatidylinositol-4-phosphate 5-Kinase family protein [Candida albicans]|nr:Phosphatidylinositol-4-phosphate 5-Kinase family protein [Candida albicans]